MKQILSGRTSCCLLLAVCLTACTKPTRIVVGSKLSTEQVVLAEITAQFLEHRLGKSANIVRRLGMGNTAIAHQALISGDIDLYPEDTGLIVEQILHGSPSSDPAITLSYARSELARKELLDLLDPLGFDNHTVIVVPAASADKAHKLSDLSEVPGTKRAAAWKLGTTADFASMEDGLAALNPYHLPMGAAPQAMKSADLFPKMTKGDIDMVATQASDPNLLSSDWKILEDDMNVFPPRQTALLLRQELVSKVPQLKGMLGELAGKINLDTIRHLTAEVDMESQKPSDVAAKFLESSGLNQ